MKKLEEEGKYRYKFLTDFVNHYKDKMFLGASDKGGGDKKGADGTEEISFDFEHYMKILNFEKEHNKGKGDAALNVRERRTKSQ